MIARDAITGLVLAGGRATRMGGVDKGLQTFEGTPLALRAAQRLMPQVGSLVINANRNLGAYEAFGFPVVTDTLSDYQGPLAGFLVGLEACKTEWLVAVPCDSPHFPADLVERLAHAIERSNALAAVPAADGQVQPVFLMMRADRLASLRAFIATGQRKITAWYAQFETAIVDFSDAAQAFVNYNSLPELHAADATRAVNRAP